MFAHILIATDGSELAQRALCQGLALAKALGAKATAVTVTEPMAAVLMDAAVPLPIENYEKAAAADAARILAGVSALAADAGVACDVLHRRKDATSLLWLRTAAAGSPSCCSAARQPVCSR